ncbi:MAG TPA: hypothetical protein VLA79_15495 [Polyangia bacterium]|nr:hypothetical protein [Polyangia bacterium]
MTWGELRLVPPLETYPRAVAAVQTPAGKLVMLAGFVTLLSLVSPGWVPIGSFLVLASLVPSRHRRVLVAGGTVVWAFVWPARAGEPAILLAGQALVFLFAGLLYAASRRFSRSALLARPVALLMALVTVYLAVVGARPGSFPKEGLAWAVAHALCSYQWFIGYALLDRFASPGEPVWKQLGTFAPFWGSTTTPFPKGAANWRKIETRTPEALAITQLKGLKLLLWCVLLHFAHRGYRWVAFHSLGILSISDAFRAVANDAPLGFLASWTSILGSFFERLFDLTVFGHTIVACCRMAGFAALRNTYRPFEARNVADFWNRYYYYFKELLVEFFYYPTFLRYFKGHPRLRRTFAVFATVFLGNIYFHFVRDDHWIQTIGFWAAVRQMDVYVVQCMMLAVAISLSQARRATSTGKGWLQERAFPLARVLVSYCLMFAFVDEEFLFPLRVHLRFFAHLFGINA